MKLLLTITGFLLVFLSPLTAQMSEDFVCTTWNENPNKEAGEEAHSIYRQALKSGDFDLAFEHWQIAYDIAPAADGKRDFHLTDGIKILKHYLKETEDETKKAELKNEIIQLYDECVACYEQRVIQLNDCDDDCYEQKVGFVLGRMGYDLFYELNAPYGKNYDVLKTSHRGE